VTIVYALLAALCNALNVTTQHAASISGPRKASGWRLAAYLLENPLWLFGWVALIGAFIFQALALNAGQLSVVQPLLVTELVFTLILRRVWIRQSIRAVTWWAAAMTCVCLSVFLATAEPQGGHLMPAAHVWLAAGSATVAVAAVLSLFGLRGSPVRRAALLATATAAMWALVAAIIKTTTQTWSQFGIAGLFTHWPVYALAAAGLVTEILEQATLHVGPLSVSQPLLVIVDPLVSIILSVWIFEEYFTESSGRLALGALSFAALCAAITVLTRTAPTTMSRPTSPPDGPPPDGPPPDGPPPAGSPSAGSPPAGSPPAGSPPTAS
jgi:hypothetical protein